jgi:predicted HTH domain antitoxin
MGLTTFKRELHRTLDELPPETLLEVLDFLDFLRFRTGRDTIGRRAREAIRLYTAKEVSLGRAAELAGMNYFAFEELLRKQDTPISEPESKSRSERVAQQEMADALLA